MWRKKSSSLAETQVSSTPVQTGVKVIRKKNIFMHADWSQSYVSDQFLGNADIYHDRYFNRLDFLNLADQYLAAANIDRDLPLKCLDIGSGGGSSVFATAKLLPNSSIIASDISPQLLELLSNIVESKIELKNRISIYCFDLHAPFFKENIFDLIVGTAILHHLLDPYEALKNVVKSLKPGGKIILVEPLEAGSLILVTMFEKVLEALQNIGENHGVIANLMRAMRLDIQSRLGVPVQKPWTQHLDDKWVFDLLYLRDLSDKLGLSNVNITPPSSHDLSNIFEQTFLDLLKESGNDGILVPNIVMTVVKEFDNGISMSLKQKLCPTGIIVFTK